MSGSDAYRTPAETGPTPKGTLAAARGREAWRSFWRHRAVEYSAFAKFVDGHFGISVIATVVLVLALLAAGVTSVARSSEVECAGMCDALKAEAHIHRQGCYCVDVDGKPWRWSEWPGTDG